jgi:membrane-bound lytic murein transglycosylase B
MKRALMCISIGLFFVPLSAFAALTQDQINTLRSEEAQLQAENTQLSSQISTLEAQGETYQRDINLLNAKIKQEQLQIEEKNIELQQIGQNITTKSTTLTQLQGQLDQNQSTLAALIRKADEQGAISLVELLASPRPLSDVFAEADAESVLKQNINAVMENTKAIASSTSAAKAALEDQQNAETDAKQTIQAQQKLVQSNKNQEAALLAANKSGRQTIQQVIANNDAKIAQIKSALFQLNGAGAIKFGDALAFAQAAESKTGVDPAFTLAILTQESNLGKNVGNCYVRDYNSGAGVNVNSGAYKAKVMNPTRDIPPFLQIANSLGFDPQNQKVSCPLSIGWGGAMGPAQFIPSTWVLPSFQSQIAAALGTTATNPWNPRDAIMASSIYLSNLGAYGTIGDHYTANRTAACHYYAGAGGCSVGGSYGTSVMNIAANIQTCMINPIVNPSGGIPSNC